MGVVVELINAEVAKPDKIKQAISQCNRFIFKYPPIGGRAHPTQIKTVLGTTLANADKIKLTRVFKSFGWSEKVYV